MNCRTIQRRLLHLERPELPPEPERSHLLECQACRDWLRRLVEIEHEAARLPVPRSSGKNRLIQYVLSDHLPADRSAVRVGLIGRVRDLAGDVARRWSELSVPVGVRTFVMKTACAAALVLAFGMALWRAGSEPPKHSVPEKPGPDPLLASLMHHDLRLAAALTPEDRVKTLANVADDLHAEAEALVGGVSAETLTGLTRLYLDVVQTGIIAQAADVPPASRAAVLDPIVARLRQAGTESERWAAAAPEEAAEPLRAMAAAARSGGESLRDLLGAAPPAEPSTLVKPQSPTKAVPPAKSPTPEKS